MDILQARRVTKLFGGLAAVSVVSFDLGQGEILGLIGPNGSGKTTLVNVVTGTLPYSDGDVLFQGRSIRGLPPYEIGRLGLSRTFQVVKPFRNLSDRIMVLYHGEKLTEGLPEEVLNNPDVVSAYLGRRYAEQAHA